MAVEVGRELGDSVRRQIGQHVLVSPERVAEVLGVPETTLALWRAAGAEAGLPWLSIGRRISYLERDVVAFIEKSRRTNGNAA
jgi:hypothetical protein